MKKFVMSLALSILFVLGVNAQSKGDFYVGTGNIANKAWTEWSVAPTVGYGITDNLMVGINVSQVDSTVDMELDIHARYYYNGMFAYIETKGLNTDNLKLGVGKMRMLHRGVYIDPKVVYDVNAKTTNLMLGIGFRFCK